VPSETYCSVSPPNMAPRNSPSGFNAHPALLSADKKQTHTAHRQQTHRAHMHARISTQGDRGPTPYEKNSRDCTAAAHSGEAELAEHAGLSLPLAGHLGPPCPGSPKVLGAPRDAAVLCT